MDRMTVTFDRKEMARALALVGNVSPWRRAVPMFDKDDKPLPPKMIAGVVQIESAGGVARIKSANYDGSLVTTIPCEGAIPLSFVPLATFSAAIEKGAGGQASLTRVADGPEVVFQCGRMRSATHAAAEDACADLPTIEAEPAIITARRLREGLSAAEPATIDDSKRPYLGGVFIHRTADGIGFVAQDGNRIHARQIAGVTADIQAIIPRRASQLLLSILPEEGDVEVEIAVSKLGATFHFENVIYRSKLIDGQFPSFQDQLRAPTDRVLRGYANELLAAFELAAIVSHPKHRDIRLDLGEKCEVSAWRRIAGGLDQGRVGLAADFTGPPLAIGFQIHLVADALRLFGEHEIEWRMGGPEDPTTVSSPFMPGLEAMVSPYRLEGAHMQRAA